MFRTYGRWVAAAKELVNQQQKLLDKAAPTAAPAAAPALAPAASAMAEDSLKLDELRSSSAD